ncbi:MAG: hypothetical protein OXC41_02280 [Gammaproteobacteria bacterium]|nr:hypothetical protein [Gammaproteobacteria bacterium]
MRLNFNVLWVEDQPDRVQAQAYAIKRHVAELAFEFVPKFCESIAKLKEEISDDLFTDEIDLVLVDYDLGSGELGQNAIVEIREVLQFKDVVFYSAHYETQQLRQITFENELEGIFCARRDDLVDEVFGIFESLTRRVLDLDHTRGIVMGATSDIDNIFKDCLIALYRKLGNEGQGKFSEEANNIVKNKLGKYTKKVDKFQKAPELLALLEQHEIFTSNDRLRILVRMLRSDTFKEYAGYEDAVVRYQQQIIPKRNVLGHQVIGLEGPQNIGIDEMRELRRSLLELRSQFRDMHSAVTKA